MVAAACGPRHSQTRHGSGKSIFTSLWYVGTWAHVTRNWPTLCRVAAGSPREVQGSPKGTPQQELLAGDCNLSPKASCQPKLPSLLAGSKGKTKELQNGDHGETSTIKPGATRDREHKTPGLMPRRHPVTRKNDEHGELDQVQVPRTCRLLAMRGV